MPPRGQSVFDQWFDDWAEIEKKTKQQVRDISQGVTNQSNRPLPKHIDWKVDPITGAIGKPTTGENDA